MVAQPSHATKEKESGSLAATQKIIKIITLTNTKIHMILERPKLFL